MEQGYFRTREFYDVAQKYMHGTQFGYTNKLMI